MSVRAARPSAGASFPLPVKGLAQHWVANKGLVQVNGAPVGSWADTVSGQLLTVDATDPANTPPTWLANVDGDNLPLVRFDGTHDMLANVGGIAYVGEELTFYLVSRCIRVSGTGKNILSLCTALAGDRSGNGAMTVLVDEPDAYRLRYNIPPTANGVQFIAPQRVGNGLYADTNTSVGILRWQVHIYRMSRIMGFAYWQLQMRAGLIEGQWSISTNTFTQTYNSLYLGSGSTNGIGWPNQIQCDVRELGIYHRGLLDNEIAALMQYAGNAWQLPGLK